MAPHEYPCLRWRQSIAISPFAREACRIAAGAPRDAGKADAADGGWKQDGELRVQTRSRVRRGAPASAVRPAS